MKDRNQAYESGIGNNLAKISCSLGYVLEQSKHIYLRNPSVKRELA
jgi:hypothetical protein